MTSGHLASLFEKLRLSAFSAMRMIPLLVMIYRRFCTKIPKRTIFRPEVTVLGFPRDVLHIFPPLCQGLAAEKPSFVVTRPFDLA